MRNHNAVQTFVQPVRRAEIMTELRPGAVQPPRGRRPSLKGSTLRDLPGAPHWPQSTASAANTVLPGDADITFTSRFALRLLMRLRQRVADTLDSRAVRLAGPVLQLGLRVSEIRDACLELLEALLICVFGSRRVLVLLSQARRERLHLVH